MLATFVVEGDPLALLVLARTMPYVLTISKDDIVVSVTYEALHDFSITS